MRNGTGECSHSTVQPTTQAGRLQTATAPQCLAVVTELACRTGLRDAASEEGQRSPRPIAANGVCTFSLATAFALQHDTIPELNGDSAGQSRVATPRRARELIWTWCAAQEIRHELAAAVYIEVAIQGFDVVVNRELTEAETRGDLLFTVALQESVEGLRLAWRQQMTTTLRTGGEFATDSRRESTR